MRISIVTLFPEMFSGPFDFSIVSRAKNQHAVEIELINLRNFSTDSYKSVDDHPYGGGTGMILRVDIVDRALQAIKKNAKNTHCILLDPQGKQYKQRMAKRLLTYEHLILLCAHYEGVDERIRDLIDEEISIGDYILTGGEIPAMVITDSIVRLLPNVLKPEATADESFSIHQLEHPHYTRPKNYKGISVPSILLSGNHESIDVWRKKLSLQRTKLRRPDILKEKKG